MVHGLRAFYPTDAHTRPMYLSNYLHSG